MTAILALQTRLAELQSLPMGDVERVDTAG